MGSKLAGLNKWEAWLSITVFTLAILLRIVPPMKYGLPYGFDVYEFISRVFVLSEGGSTPLPHGPLFYYVQLIVLMIMGSDTFFKILFFLEPILFTFFILPPYFISKQLKALNNKPIYTLLYVATINLLVHQIGGVVIPEGLGILFYGLAILFSMKALMGRWSWMLLVMFSGFLAAISHHLSVFQLVLFLTSLFLSYLYYYIKYEKKDGLLNLLVLIFTGIVLLVTSSALVWSLMGEEENMLKLLLEIITRNYSLLFTLIIGMLVFPIITVEVIRFVKRYKKFHFTEIFVSTITVGIIVPSSLTAVTYPEALPTILWFAIPISLGFLPFAIYGLIHYSKKSSLYEAIFFLAPLMIFMVEALFMLSLENYRVLIHRVPTFIIYFAVPLAGYGLSCYSSELNSLNKQYLAGMIISYFIFSLASTSYPKSEFTYGIKESISYSELELAKDAYRYSTIFNSKIDTDTRLGVLIMFVSHRKATWTGNLTSWFLPSNSWLVNVSISGEPYALEDDALIVISDTMRGIYKGRVVNLITKPSGSLNEEVVSYLNNSPGIDRIEDTQNGALYKYHSWKKLNYSDTRNP